MSFKFTVVSFVFVKNKNGGCGTTKNPTFNIWSLFIIFNLSFKQLSGRLLGIFLVLTLSLKENWLIFWKIMRTNNIVELFFYLKEKDMINCTSANVKIKYITILLFIQILINISNTRYKTITVTILLKRDHLCLILSRN